MSNFKLFETKQIRSVWDEAGGKWYFSVADVIEVLADSAHVRDYIKKMRKREPELNANWGTMCTPLEILAPMASVERQNIRKRTPQGSYQCSPVSIIRNTPLPPGEGQGVRAYKSTSSPISAVSPNPTTRPTSITFGDEVMKVFRV